MFCNNYYIYLYVYVLRRVYYVLVIWCDYLIFKVNALLPAETFIQVVSGLLGNKLPTVRRKAMELLNNKLMNQKDYFDEDQVI